jgi:hypothetical protein
VHFVAPTKDLTYAKVDTPKSPLALRAVARCGVATRFKEEAASEIIFDFVTSAKSLRKYLKNVNFEQF